MDALAWPSALIIRSISFAPVIPSRSGGSSMTGAEQVVASPAGRWKATAALLVRREEALLQYRAMMAGLMGRVGTVLVGPYDGVRPFDANWRQMSGREAAGHEDGAYLFDHGAYGQTSVTRATAAAGAEQGATELLATLVDGVGPRPGHYFGIGARLYIVRTVWHTGASSATMRFWPRLREAVTLGDMIILDRPVCTMRLASDDSGELVQENYAYSTPSISLVEAI